jgi:hypothetical protein
MSFSGNCPCLEKGLDNPLTGNRLAKDLMLCTRNGWEFSGTVSREGRREKQQSN